MDNDSAEIAQISFFLAKNEKKFEDVIDANKDVLGRSAAVQHDFNLDESDCRFFYFESLSFRKNPPWLDFVNENLPPKQSISFNTQSKSANGILLISVEGRIFAATFGRSASSYLDKSSIEADFGIKTAMNMCGNEEIRQTRSQSHAITPTQIDRQVGKPSDTFVFGLSEAEDLRYISAHIKEEKNVTLQGRDNLTVKVIGDRKLNWSDLIARCKDFLQAYGRKDYESLFPNYKNFIQASNEEIEQLDASLITALKNREFDKIQLGIPEFVSEEDYSFSYSNNKVKSNYIYSFLHVDQLDKHLKLDEIEIKNLKNKQIFAYSHEEDRILPYRRWQLYKCLIFELEIDDRYFVLSDGRWLEVDHNFYQNIVRFTRDVLHEEPCESDFEDIDISDDKQKKNLELIFNKEVCERRNTAILFDRAKLRIGEGPKNKEFCDILDLTDDHKMMRIIHCKPYKDSSSTSYLFSQAQLYCEAFLRDETFLSEIRGHIGASDNNSKNDYLAYIKDQLSEINGRDYVVCLWLLYDQLEAKPDRLEMPLMAQYELKLLHDRLRNAFKFHDVIIRFVPVFKKRYLTDKKPV